jgi:hypothetical protein
LIALPNAMAIFDDQRIERRSLEDRSYLGMLLTTSADMVKGWKMMLSLSSERIVVMAQLSESSGLGFLADLMRLRGDG